MNYLPWARTKLLGSQFAKYFVLSLPFFCINNFMQTQKNCAMELFNHSLKINLVLEMF